MQNGPQHLCALFRDGGANHTCLFIGFGDSRFCENQTSGHFRGNRAGRGENVLGSRQSVEQPDDSPSFQLHDQAVGGEDGTVSVETESGSTCRGFAQAGPEVAADTAHKVIVRASTSFFKPIIGSSPSIFHSVSAMEVTVEKSVRQVAASFSAKIAFTSVKLP